jgi:hypothetical protein
MDSVARWFMTCEKDVAPRLALGTRAGYKTPRYELRGKRMQMDRRRGMKENEIVLRHR